MLLADFLHLFDLFSVRFFDFNKSGLFWMRVVKALLTVLFVRMIVYRTKYFRVLWFDFVFSGNRSLCPHLLVAEEPKRQSMEHIAKGTMRGLKVDLGIFFSFLIGITWALVLLCWHLGWLELCHLLDCLLVEVNLLFLSLLNLTCGL